MKKPDESAGSNNRSLALRKTFGLTKSGWELSVKDCSHSCLILGLYLAVGVIFLAFNFTTFVASKNQAVKRDDIEDIFSKFSELNVLIIGDAMVDNYLWGKADRISAEAPVPVVTVIRQEARLGGAGNVSLNLQALGANPILITFVGDDDNGKIFTNLMKENHLSSDRVFADKNRMTTVKTRIYSGDRQVARVDQEVSALLDSDFEAHIFAEIVKVIDTERISVVVFVDYDKGLITPWLIRKVVELAKSRNLLTVADPKIRNFDDYREIDLLKPNFKEFRDGLKLQIEMTDLKKLKAIAENFKNENNIGMLLITLSELGVWVSNGEMQNYFPAEVRNIADVSGAGDTVVAMASLCLATGLSAALTAQLSNLAGGLVCEKPGVVSVDREQLKKEAEKILAD